MEMNSKEQSSFWQFSDQLRLHTANLTSLSIGDSIWSEDRRNNNNIVSDTIGHLGSDGWKMGPTASAAAAATTNKLAFGYNNFDNRHNNNNNNSNNQNISGYNKNFINNNSSVIDYGKTKSSLSKEVSKPAMDINNIHGNNRRLVDNNGGMGIGIGNGKKMAGNGNNYRNNIDNNNSNNNSVDKRFKTLPPSEALPRSEAIGGYIFVCNNDTMQENLKRQLFGLPPRYRDSVRAITPGLPLFLYNYSNHQLHGIFEAASFGGTNIDPTAWEDKKSHGESRFPAQVKVLTRKICEPLEEDAFRPILHHYDGPKFRLELSVPEALALLDSFAENTA